jgi:hypothetical protein
MACESNTEKNDRICHIGLFVIGLSHWVSRKADEWEWVTATEI